MARTFRVGIIGNHDYEGQNAFGFKFGIEVFDLTVNQICSLLENPDADFSVQNSRPDFPTPVMTYSLFSGGRTIHTVSREEMSKAVVGMEVLVARLNTTLQSTFYGVHFVESILSENISGTCKSIVARIVGSKTSNSIKPEDFLQMYGLHNKVFKRHAYTGNFFVITDKSQAESSEGKKKKNKQGMLVNVNRVKSELETEQIKGAVLQPVKETVTAGKAISGLGARIGRWFSSLIKTN